MPILHSGQIYYFVRSGRVDLPYGSLRYASYDGRSWSPTVYSTPYAYNLNITAIAVYPSNNYHRYLGFPIRCVAL